MLVAGSNTPDDAILYDVSSSYSGECKPLTSLCDDEERINDVTEVGRICSLTQQMTEHGETTNCLSIDGEFRPIQAVMCDGRPECLFGDDECGGRCHNSTSSPPEFCQLLISNVGYVCPGEKRDNTETVAPCNGIEECPGGIDELHCPTRKQCTQEYFDTYDVSEACDGVSNCKNSADEDPAICSTSSTASEEFQPESELFMCDQDMTNVNYSVVLTILLMALSSCGLVGNLVAMGIASLNAHLLQKWRNKLRLPNFHQAFIQESGFYFTSALSKSVFSASVICVFLFNFGLGNDTCAKDLEWRGTEICQLLGALGLTCAVASVSNLAFQTLVLAVACPERNILQNDHRQKGGSPSIGYVVLTVLYPFSYALIVWVPAALLVFFMSNSFESHIWVEVDQSLKMMPSRVVSQKEAIDFAETILTMKEVRLDSATSSLSWANVEKIIAENLPPSFQFHVKSTLGYFSSSNMCSANIFTNPLSSEHDLSTADYFGIGLMYAVCFFCVCSALTSLFLCHVTKPGGRIGVTQYHPYTLNKDLFRHSLLELLTWVPIAIMYVLNTVRADTIAVTTYQIVVMCLLAANYGFGAVLLQLRTSRVNFVNFRRRSSVSAMP